MLPCIYIQSMLRANHNTNQWAEYVETKWCDPSSAPIKRRPPCRPKKKRARELNEPTSGKRAGISKQCKTCGKLGHNKRSCKGEIGGNSSLPGTTNKTKTYNKVIKWHYGEIVAIQYSLLTLFVNFLFVDQQNHKCSITGQDSLIHNICTTTSCHA